MSNDRHRNGWEHTLLSFKFLFTIFASVVSVIGDDTRLLKYIYLVHGVLPQQLTCYHVFVFNLCFQFNDFEGEIEP